MFGCSFRGPNLFGGDAPIGPSGDAGGDAVAIDAIAIDATAIDVGAVDAVAVDAALDAPAPDIVFRQLDTTYSTQQIVVLAVTMPQIAHDLGVVMIGWSGANAVSSITDTAGNSYQLAVGPTASTSMVGVIYYTCDLAAATSNTVKVAFQNPLADYMDFRIAEYSGLRTSGCLDTTSAGSGQTLQIDSGQVSTGFSHELLLATDVVLGATTAGDPSYTNRGIDGFQDVIEDRVVMTTGSFRALATQGTTGDWVMQLATFKGQ